MSLLLLRVSLVNQNTHPRVYVHRLEPWDAAASHSTGGGGEKHSTNAWKVSRPVRPFDDTVEEISNR